MHAARRRTLDFLLRLGRPLKLNYVYRGPEDAEDLGPLLAWAAGRKVVVGLLDDLHDPWASELTLRHALRSLRGRWRAERQEQDPHSLATTLLHWDDGLQVELKSEQLGRRAPWTSCRACPRRARCREGIYALRLSADGALRLCMDRPDLALPLAERIRRGHADAAAAWTHFVEEHRP